MACETNQNRFGIAALKCAVSKIASKSAYVAGGAMRNNKGATIAALSGAAATATGAAVQRCGNNKLEEANKILAGTAVWSRMADVGIRGAQMEFGHPQSANNMIDHATYNAKRGLELLKSSPANAAAEAMKERLQGTLGAANSLQQAVAAKSPDLKGILLQSAAEQFAKRPPIPPAMKANPKAAIAAALITGSVAAGASIGGAKLRDKIRERKAVRAQQSFTINGDDWTEQFKPERDSESNAHRLYDSLDEIDDVPNERIWTLREEDGKAYISPGIHAINRLGYYVTQNEWDSPNLQAEIEEG